MSKHNATLQELISNSQELKEVVEWFCVENKIDINKITLKEIKELIGHVKEEEPLDEKKFENLIKKMK